MSNFLQFLARERAGLIVLLGLVCSLVIILLIVAWTFSLGRFSGRTKDIREPLRYVIAQFFAKLVDDFRHLLAMVVLMIFAGALLVVFQCARGLDEAKDGLQAVAATMGGLVGTIIGYYFGESAATRGRRPFHQGGEENGTDSREVAVQREAEEVKGAPPPPPSSDSQV